MAIPALAPPLRPEEEGIALGDGKAGDAVSGPAAMGWVDEEGEGDDVVPLDASVEADEAVESVEDVEAMDLVIWPPRMIWPFFLLIWVPRPSAQQLVASKPQQ